MDVFETNPFMWSIEGNIVGSELGLLNDLNIFTLSNAYVNYDDDMVVDGFTLTAVELTYDAP